MRRSFGKIITELADRDDKIYVLVGDIGYRVFDKFREKYPDRFINMGICEQSMIGVSAGMALEGLKPWVYTITPFLIERPFEQVKLDIDQQNVNVKLIGFSDYPKLGPTHTELDGQKMMQLFKNINSYFPKNGDETSQFVNEAYDNDGPAFISLKSDPALSRSITGSEVSTHDHLK
jgi:transketolase